MNRKEFWDETKKVLLIALLVVAILSLTMNIFSMFLEKKSIASVTTVTPMPAEQTSVLKVLVGGSADYGLHASGSDYTALFSGIQETVANYDVSCYSQKTLIGTDVPVGFGDTLTGLGFNLVGLANPAAMHAGKTGIETSMAYWQATENHIGGTNLSTDEQNQIQTFQVKNFTVAFLSFTDQLDQDLPEQEKYLVNVYDDTRSPQLVQKADEAADVVIVSIFWSGQNQAMPNERQQQIARALADAGASVIVGNAPDGAIQPVAWIDDTLIFYSAGSLVSDSASADQRYGILGAVDITMTTSYDKKKIELTNPRVDLIDSLDTGSGFRARLVSSLSSSELADKNTIYNSYRTILQQMDDSIRVGGLQ